MLCSATPELLRQLSAVFLKGELFQSRAGFSLLSKFFEKSRNILESSVTLYNFKLITSYYCNFIRFILPPRKKKALLTSNFLY